MPRLSLPRSPLTLGLSALAALALAAVFLALRSPSGDAAETTQRTATVKKGVVQTSVSGTGNLAPANELSLSFGTSGTVTKVYVEEGEHVSQGQLIARIGNASQKVALAQAEAELATAESAVTNATASTTTDSAITYVMASATTETTPVTTTPAETTPTQTTPVATTPSASTSNSASSSSSSSSGAGAAPSGSSGSGSSASGGSASGGSAAGGSGSSGSTTSAESAAAQVASAELAVEEAEAALDATELRAPVAGTISALSGSVGDSVGSGSSGSSSSSAASTGGDAAGGASTTTTTSSSSGFATLSQLSKLSMSVSFSESDIGKVKVGQAATVTVSAVDDTKLAARVTKVGLVATTSNSVVSYPVELSVSQTADGVRSGMSASAEIVVEQATGALTVPTHAVTGSGSRASVTVVADGERTTRTVTTGITGDSAVQIVIGLEEGDVVSLPTLQATSTAGSSSSTSGQASGALGGGAAAGGGGFGGASGGPPSGFSGGGGPPTR